MRHDIDCRGSNDGQPRRVKGKHNWRTCVLVCVVDSCARNRRRAAIEEEIDVARRTDAADRQPRLGPLLRQQTRRSQLIKHETTLRASERKTYKCGDVDLRVDAERERQRRRRRARRVKVVKGRCVAKTAELTTRSSDAAAIDAPLVVPPGSVAVIDANGASYASRALHDLVASVSCDERDARHTSRQRYLLPEELKYAEPAALARSTARATSSS